MGEREFDAIISVQEIATMCFVFLNNIIFFDSIIRFLASVLLLGMIVSADAYLAMNHPQRLGMNTLYLFTMILALIACEMIS